MDDDDKIRRNLIVTSAIVIGAAWFNVSLPEVLERLFSIKTVDGTKSVVLSEWKVWLAALAVIGYMGWRYRWSDEVEKATAEFAASTLRRYQFLFGQVYLAKVADWFKRGETPGDMHPQLAPLYAQVVPESVVSQLGRRPENVTFTGMPPGSTAFGNVMMTATTEWRLPNGGIQSNTQPVNVYIDAKRQQALIWKARRYSLVNSKASMSLAWPVLIAGAAALVVLYKLGRAILG